jgi:hypothetical protein
LAGWLTVFDNAGEERFANNEPTAGTYTIDGLNPSDIGNGPWTLQLIHDAGAPQGVDYDILVVYHGDGAGQETTRPHPEGSDPAAAWLERGFALLDQELAPVLHA